jgi:cytochrome P450
VPLQTWVLTRYDDVRAVLRASDVFSTSAGVMLQDARKGVNLATQFFPPGAEQITFSDPPRHGELRQVINPGFVASAIERATPRLRALVDRTLDEVPADGRVDWAQLAGRGLPVRLVSELLGLSEQNEEDILFWSDELERTSDPNLPPASELVAAADAVDQLDSVIEFLRRELELKVAAPGEDLLTMLVEARSAGTCSEVNALMFAQTVLLASNDSVGSLVTGIVHHLGENTGQLAAVRADRALVPAAVEETLRYSCPDRGFMRTAMADTQIAGTPVRRGERVYLAFDAANRDGSVFSNPETFDITVGRRRANIAFGIGIHGCVAQMLVRRFAQLLLDRLLDRFETFAPAGDPVRKPSVTRHAWQSLPMSFTPVDPRRAP